MIQPVVKAVEQPVGQPVECLFTRCLVQPVVQPGWQPVVSCKRDLRVKYPVFTARAAHVVRMHSAAYACQPIVLATCHSHIYSLLYQNLQRKMVKFWESVYY